MNHFSFNPIWTFLSSIGLVFVNKVGINAYHSTNKKCIFFLSVHQFLILRGVVGCGFLLRFVLAVTPSHITKINSAFNWAILLTGKPLIHQGCSHCRMGVATLWKKSLLTESCYFFHTYISVICCLALEIVRALVSPW